MVRVVVLEKREVRLLEIPDVFGHAGDLAPCDLRAQHPPAFVPLRESPGRHQAGRPVRERPFRPVLVFECKGPAQLDGVHLEPLQHVLIHDGELLDRIIDADGFLRQAEIIAQPCVGHGGYARRAVAGQINRHAARFLVVQRRENSFTRSHAEWYALAAPEPSRETATGRGDCAGGKPLPAWRRELAWAALRGGEPGGAKPGSLGRTGARLKPLVVARGGSQVSRAGIHLCPRRI